MIEQNVPRTVNGNAVSTTRIEKANMKTVVCHFYNEEHLLPWWLKHHKNIFDHGIMIDYFSTDRSMEIIREICPTWEIRYTRNQYFDATPIDREVMNIEKMLGGWRMCLNVTEFLYGNIDHLQDLPDPTQYFIGNYVFVDMENPQQGQTILDHNYPLHQQRHWGYDTFENTGAQKGGVTGRMNRSIHNYPIEYKGGRHWGGADYPKSFDDLVIFYYGNADASAAGVKRKAQIYSKISPAEQGGMSSYHITDEEAIRGRIREQKGYSRDLRAEIGNILEHNRRITGAEW
jgi:hypothetical protein